LMLERQTAGKAEPHSLIYYLSGRCIADRKESHKDAINTNTKTNERQPWFVGSAVRNLFYYASGRYIVDRDETLTSRAIPQDVSVIDSDELEMNPVHDSRTQLQYRRCLTEDSIVTSSFWYRSLINCVYHLSGRFIVEQQLSNQKVRGQLKNALEKLEHAENLTKQDDNYNVSLPFSHEKHQELSPEVVRVHGWRLRLCRCCRESQDIDYRSFFVDEDGVETYRSTNRLNHLEIVLRDTMHVVAQQPCCVAALFSGALLLNPWLRSMLPQLWHGLQYDSHLMRSSLTATSAFLSSGLLLDRIAWDGGRSPF